MIGSTSMEEDMESSGLREKDGGGEEEKYERSPRTSVRGSHDPAY